MDAASLSLGGALLLTSRLTPDVPPQLVDMLLKNDVTPQDQCNTKPNKKAFRFPTTLVRKYFPDADFPVELHAFIVLDKVPQKEVEVVRIAKYTDRKAREDWFQYYMYGLGHLIAAYRDKLRVVGYTKLPVVGRPVLKVFLSTVLEDTYSEGAEELEVADQLVALTQLRTASSLTSPRSYDGGLQHSGQTTPDSHSCPSFLELNNRQSDGPGLSLDGPARAKRSRSVEPRRSDGGGFDGDTNRDHDVSAAEKERYPRDPCNTKPHRNTFRFPTTLARKYFGDDAEFPIHMNAVVFVDGVEQVGNPVAVRISKYMDRTSKYTKVQHFQYHMYGLVDYIQAYSSQVRVIGYTLTAGRAGKDSALSIFLKSGEWQGPEDLDEREAADQLVQLNKARTSPEPACHSDDMTSCHVMVSRSPSGMRGNGSQTGHIAGGVLVEPSLKRSKSGRPPSPSTFKANQLQAFGSALDLVDMPHVDGVRCQDSPPLSSSPPLSRSPFAAALANLGQASVPFLPGAEIGLPAVSASCHNMLPLPEEIRRSLMGSLFLNQSLTRGSFTSPSLPDGEDKDLTEEQIDRARDADQVCSAEGVAAIADILAARFGAHLGGRDGARVSNDFGTPSNCEHRTSLEVRDEQQTSSQAVHSNCHNTDTSSDNHNTDRHTDKQEDQLCWPVLSDAETLHDVGKGILKVFSFLGMPEDTRLAIMQNLCRFSRDEREGLLCFTYPHLQDACERQSKTEVERILLQLLSHT